MKDITCASGTDWLTCVTWPCEGCQGISAALQASFAAQVASGAYDERGCTLTERRRSEKPTRGTVAA